MVGTLLGLVEYAENLDPTPRDAIREDERQSGNLQLTNVRIALRLLAEIGEGAETLGCFNDPLDDSTGAIASSFLRNKGIDLGKVSLRLWQPNDFHSFLIGQNVWDGCRQFTLASERLRPRSHSIVGNEHALLSFDLGLLQFFGLPSVTTDILFERLGCEISLGSLGGAAQKVEIRF